MASGDNVDVIEVVETSFSGPTAPALDHRPEQSAEEDCEYPHTVVRTSRRRPSLPRY